MKLLSNLVVAVVICSTTTITSFGQEEGQSTRKLLIHVDHVILSKAADYEAAIKGFVNALKEHGVENTNQWAHVQRNGDYLHVSALENMAMLDAHPLMEVYNKMGKEAWDEMYSKFSDTYHSHESYVVNHHPDKSYNMAGLGAEGVNYRVWDFFYFEEKDWNTVMNLSKKWKELYESNNIEYGYGVYTNGFGYPGPVIATLRWAKSPEEYHAQITEINKTLGEDGSKLWAETVKYIRKSDRIDGWFRPDLSYITTPDESARNEEQ